MNISNFGSCIDLDGASKIVFVGNLSWTTTVDQLMSFLSQAGGIISTEVQHFEDTNRSKGWA